MWSSFFVLPIRVNGGVSSLNVQMIDCLVSMVASPIPLNMRISWDLMSTSWAEDGTHAALSDKRRFPLRLQMAAHILASAAWIDEANLPRVNRPGGCWCLWAAFGWQTYSIKSNSPEPSTDVAFPQGWPLLTFVQGRRGEVGDGNAAARPHCEQEDQLGFAQAQIQRAHLAFVERDAGNIHRDPERTNTHF